VRVQPPQTVLAFDPGRDKCGVAVVCRDGVLRARSVVPVAEVEAVVTEWALAREAEAIVLGDSTTSRQWQEKIARWLPQIPIVVVDERGSTLEARTLYWEFIPPRGWRRMVPLSLQTPPEPVDDFAAVVLARRFFASFSDETSSPDTS
jgi:RNase H-fold protein (predicted Holliday junction resolvase)